jgi:hypothetical protein
VQDVAEPGREDAHRRGQAQQPGRRPQAAREARLRINSKLLLLACFLLLISALLCFLSIERKKFLQLHSMSVLLRGSVCVITVHVWITIILRINNRFETMNISFRFIVCTLLHFKVEEAVQLFQRMQQPQRTVVSSTTMVTGLAKNGFSSS